MWQATLPVHARACTGAIAGVALVGRLKVRRVRVEVPHLPYFPYHATHGFMRALRSEGYVVTRQRIMVNHWQIVARRGNTTEVYP